MNWGNPPVYHLGIGEIPPVSLLDIGLGKLSLLIIWVLGWGN
jgi:hypothetical protein